MSYFSHRAATEPIVVPGHIAKGIDRSWIPENFKLPTWFDDYADQVMGNKMSDECLEIIRNLKGLRCLYGIHFSDCDRRVYDGHVWRASEVCETFLYNAHLAANYLKDKYPEKPITQLYKTSFYLMPPINELNEIAASNLRRLYWAVEHMDNVEEDESVPSAILDALSKYELQQAALVETPPCKIRYGGDSPQPYVLVNVSGSPAGVIEIPVFAATDSVNCKCLLVPTSQAVVNSLRGYEKPKVDPLPERVELCNVASTHFTVDFTLFVYPKSVYAGLVSISAYLNNRIDDTADTDNQLDTFYKFVSTKEK